MQEQLIDTHYALARWCAHLKDQPWLALDTEFIRERSYYPRLCLIQVASATRAALIDPLAIDDFDPLREVLLDQGIEKILHAAHQDLEILLHRLDCLPSPVFDTQTAAIVLGFGEQLGYGRLVELLLETHLEKGHTRTPWCQRPLSTGQLRYAFDDVVHLGPLYRKMHAMLEQHQRLQWMQAEAKALTDPNRYQVDPQAAWKKVKGRQQLRGRRLAVLQALSAWREIQAMQRDLPRRWIIKDESLLELAQRMPRVLPQLETIHGLDKGLIRHHGRALLNCIAQAKSLPESAWPKHTQPPREDEEAILDWMSAALRILARNAGLSPSSIAKRKDLLALLRHDKAAILLHGWRYEAAGSALCALLANQKHLHWDTQKHCLSLQKKPAVKAG